MFVMAFNQLSSSSRVGANVQFCPYIRLLLGRPPGFTSTGSIDRNLPGIDFHSQPVLPARKATARKARSAGLSSTSKLSNSRVNFLSSLFAVVRELSRDRIHSSRVQYSMAISCRNGPAEGKGHCRKNLRKAAPRPLGLNQVIEVQQDLTRRRCLRNGLLSRWKVSSH